MCVYIGEFIKGVRHGAGELNFGGKKYLGQWLDDCSAATAIPNSIGSSFSTGKSPPRSFWSRDPLKPKVTVSDAAGARVRARAEEGQREVEAVVQQVALVVKHAQ